MNIKALKAKMMLNNITNYDLANNLKISKTSVSNKLTGKSEFKRNEIDELIKILHLTQEEVNDIFFGIKVS